MVIWEHEGNVDSTFIECSQMNGVFYHSVILGLGFFICFKIYILHAQNNKTRFFYVLYSDKTWVFDHIGYRVLSIFWYIYWCKVYIWNNSYLNCGCRWKWRMIIAVNFPKTNGKKKPEKIRASLSDNILLKIKFSCWWQYFNLIYKTSIFFSKVGLYIHHKPFGIPGFLASWFWNCKCTVLFI